MEDAPMAYGSIFQRKAFSVLACALLLAAVPATAKEKKTVSSGPSAEDFARLQEDVWKLNKGQAELKEQMAKLVESLAQTRAMLEGSAAGQARVAARLDELMREVIAISERLGEPVPLKPRTAESSTSSAAAGGAAPSQSAVPPAAAAPASADPVSSGPAAAEAKAPALPSAPAPPPAAKADQMYQSAYGDYSRGNYPLALMGFEDFLKNFPKHKNAEDAHYFIGECHYAQKDFEKAASAYDQLLQQFPEGNKAPAALLKKGYSHLELYRIGQGVVTLQGLIQKYPHSPEAQLAKQKLQELGLSR